MRRTPVLLAALPLLALGLTACGGGGSDRTFADVDASVCDSVDLEKAITAEFPDAKVTASRPKFQNGWTCVATVKKAQVQKGLSLTQVTVLFRIAEDDAKGTQAYGELAYPDAKPQAIKGWWSDGVVESTGGAGVHFVQARGTSHNAVVDVQAQFTKAPTTNGDHADETGQTLVEGLLNDARGGLTRSSAS